MYMNLAATAVVQLCKYPKSGNVFSTLADK